ncbi:hypothetical protein MHU86_13588 [Fragilaria crotonensis]|nr:hypothetical protein MHU86_13588 [Fragilaria crotonensis]
MADVASDPKEPSRSFPPKISFSHVHFYVDHLEDLETYKELENSLNSLCRVNTSTAALPRSWQDPTKGESESEPQSFQSQGRDLVRQCLAGLGFRITGARYPSHGDEDGTKASNTRSVLITSRDSEGVQFVVTAIAPETKTVEYGDKAHYQHFDSANLERFYQCHSNRQGIAVLAFNVDSVDAIHSKYEKLHPKLVWARNDYESAKILEVFAYYSDNVDEQGMKEPDHGTILRFVERDLEATCSSVLPGLVPVDASFDQPSQPAYCDHWVSNVQSRTDFLSTLHDTLGFAPKVDFNAGVVAAGEAQIESTVTGNSTPALLLDSTNTSLRNQSQVYLPINNDLSQVGHVHGFLKEIGQGIQHVASRVENLVEFVQAANDWRKKTGRVSPFWAFLVPIMEL